MSLFDRGCLVFVGALFSTVVVFTLLLFYFYVTE